MLTISFYKELAAGTEIVCLSRNDARLCISCALPRGASHLSANMDFKNNTFCYRPLVKSAQQKNNFLISQPSHMLWVLIRTVSMRRFF